MIKKLCGLMFLFSVCFNSNATIITINFEDFTGGDLISTVGNATFSSNGSVQVFNFGGDYASSGVNVIAPDSAGGLYNGDLFVDFEQAVNNLSFFSGGDDINGVQFSIRVFIDGILGSTLDLSGDGALDTIDFHDLSTFSNITRIEIFNVVDPAGLVYDDFSFSIAEVPEPSALVLLGLGLIGIAVRRKHNT